MLALRLPAQAGEVPYRPRLPGRRGYALQFCHPVQAMPSGHPNVADPEVMWDWLRAYSVPFYDTFWGTYGIEEYKKIYGKSFAGELLARGIPPEDPEFQAILDEQREKASYHFGDPHLNIATLAGIFRMALKAYDAAHGLETERNVTAYISRDGFWRGE